MRVGLQLQAIGSSWLHSERGSSRGNLTYGAWGTHGGHGQQDDRGKGRIGEMGWGTQRHPLDGDAKAGFRKGFFSPIE